MLLRQRRAHRLQIVAGIQPFRDRADVLAERLAVPEEGGTREHVDLGAGIVDVVFAGDVVATELEQACQRVAEHGAAAMANMHRSGRVGRDVFDIDLGATADAAVVSALAQHRPQRLGPGGRLQRQIDEAGAGDVDLGDQRVGTEPLGDLLGEVAGLCLCLFRKHHGGVGRHVAMGGIARRLDHHAREIDTLGPVGVRRERAAGGVHAREHVGEQVQC